MVLAIAPFLELLGYRASSAWPMIPTTSGPLELTDLNK